MTSDEKISVFNRELSYIENETIRFIAREMLAEAPDYFFEIPASSTGKYHPTYALGNGGLVRHTKAAVKFAKILEPINPFEFSKTQFDVVYAALILHDTCKHGVSDAVKHDYSIFEHPILISNKILEIFEFNEAFLEIDEQARDIHDFARIIAEATASHMGQFNTNKHSAVTLPLPKTNVQKFVHLCDFLASRKELDVEGLAE